MEVLLYAIPMGIMLSLAAGPVFFVVIETSISKGKGAAFSLDLGAVAADIIFILIAYYGSKSFLSSLENNPWVAIVSGALVSVFGLYYIVKKKTDPDKPKRINLTKKRYFFVKGFLLNIFNVGVLFYWIATTVAIGSMVNHDARSLWVFYAAAVGVYLAVDLLKIFYANRFKERLAGNTMYIIEKCIGVILVGFGIYIALHNS